MNPRRSAVPALVTALVVALVASAFSLAGAGPATSASVTPAPGPGNTLLAGSYQAELGRLSVTEEPRIANVAAPVIAGKPRLGHTLTVSTGAWKPAAVKLTYRWFRGTTRIDGADSASYTPGAGDVGSLVSVQVSAEKSGYRSASATQTVGTIQAGKISMTKRPALRGKKALVGKTLKVTSGSWSVKGVTVSYTWIKGARELTSAKKYRLRKSDATKRLQVVVTASKRGYDSQSVRLKTDRIKRR